MIAPPAAPFQSAVPNNLSNEEADQSSKSNLLVWLVHLRRHLARSDIEKGLDQAAEEAKLPESPVFGLPTVPSDGSCLISKTQQRVRLLSHFSPALPPLPNLTQRLRHLSHPQIIMEHGGMAPTPQEGVTSKWYTADS